MFRFPVVFALGALVGGQFAASHAAPLAPAAVILPTAGVARAPEAFEQDRPIMNVRGLVAVLHGLPALVCGLTAEAAAGWGGGSWMNAPAPPLGPDATLRLAGFPRARMVPSEITMLIDSLASNDNCVREVAVRLIGRVRASYVEERLIAQLSTSRAVPTREAAALALGLVRSKDAVAPLERLIGDDAVGVRANAVWALGRIGEKSVASSMRRSLRDEEELVRLAGAGAVGALEDVDAVDDLLQVLRTDQVARVRRSAAWALGALRQRRAADGMVAALRGEQDDDVRETITWALGNLRAESAASALTELLQRDKSGEVRENAAWALGSMRASSAAAALGAAAGRDSSADVRGTAAWALGQLHVNEAPDGLVRAVTDQDADVRGKAAWALSNIGDARAATALRAALRTETNSTARRAQIRALVRSGEQSESFFKELLSSEDPEVREAAVRGMAGHGMNPWPWPMPRPRPFP
ncbi:MAG: HEAT repeat domain-containing protein [Gemmatimonadetes bacterium]|nr:HEAT repeat domain-containing protein [Gemmatimonadota bacterium]